MNFCTILRLLIEENNLTQKKVAQDLSIPPSTMGGYVQGTSEPDFDTLKILAKYFNVSTDYLLDVHTSQTHHHGEAELLRIFRSLSKKQQELLLEQGKVILKLNLREKMKAAGNQ